MPEDAYAVLLKDGLVDVVLCDRSAVFEIARDRGAGICGVFGSREEAEAFVDSIDVLPGCMRPPHRM